MFRGSTAYVIDCFFQEGGQKFRRESFHINAPSDAEAIAEAQFFGPAKQPHHWQLRAVSQEGYAVIYSSCEGDEPVKC